ncbi:hypothetical protein COCMIDRAFT_26079 [Bipolaris oryzae ATCC 44560]|uniref:Uncharacterized protein n=1 Tax=Bipolaris oryzae ATCC 44560 TaxID=930090 RepID=W6Z239_COCMI|nr:uncharacterized protein COCMIDRAFT_26079 [Bipolaris oryzae ATCC 44560]EUC45817.1 hypothetical protein COCMIDRAFT_26079 [Bipolaris oryzae ATCC 44560]
MPSWLEKEKKCIGTHTLVKSVRTEDGGNGRMFCLSQDESGPAAASTKERVMQQLSSAKLGVHRTMSGLAQACRTECSVQWNTGSWTSRSSCMLRPAASMSRGLAAGPGKTGGTYGEALCPCVQRRRAVVGLGLFCRSRVKRQAAIGGRWRHLVSCAKFSGEANQWARRGRRTKNWRWVGPNVHALAVNGYGSPLWPVADSDCVFGLLDIVILVLALPLPRSPSRSRTRGSPLRPPYRLCGRRVPAHGSTSPLHRRAAFSSQTPHLALGIPTKFPIRKSRGGRRLLLVARSDLQHSVRSSHKTPQPFAISPSPYYLV